MTRLRINANWPQAARELMESLRFLANDHQRERFLAELAICLGEHNFPLFIKLLCVVGASADPAAKVLLADTCAAALRSGILPGGTLSSWGAAPAYSVNSALLSRWQLPRRRFLPIEYLVVWHAQGVGCRPLGKDGIRRSLAELLDLLSASPKAAQVFQVHLFAMADSGLEGSFSSNVRAYLREISSRWECGEQGASISEFLANATLDILNPWDGRTLPIRN